MKPIYLDYNATTPLLDEVAEAMAPWQRESFGNPSSQHSFGRRAQRALDDAREEIAAMLGARLTGRQPDRLLFTSGGTEANNQVLFGLAGAGNRTEPSETIVSSMEHASVAAVAARLEQLGILVHPLQITRDGLVDLSELERLLGPQTRFVSIMLANNETGVLQPVAEAARLCAHHGVPLHTDAAQAVGKVPVDFAALGCSAMSVAAHKFHGPLGIGALVLRHDVALPPLLHGGHQQEGLRPGTEPVALVVGLQAALAAWTREAQSRGARLAQLRDRLENELAARLDLKVTINGAASPRLPNTTNIAFAGVDRQALLMALDLAGVACSTGSACASGSSEPSPVLAAMGCEKEVLNGAIRISLGATTTATEIDEAIERIVGVCTKIAAGNRQPARSRA